MESLAGFCKVSWKAYSFLAWNWITRLHLEPLLVVGYVKLL
jgi:hypothetical protein